MTQPQMAKELGIGLSTVARYEGGVPPFGSALAPYVLLAGRKNEALLYKQLRLLMILSLGPEFVRALEGDISTGLDVRSPDSEIAKLQAGCMDLLQGESADSEVASYVGHLLAGGQALKQQRRRAAGKPDAVPGVAPAAPFDRPDSFAGHNRIAAMDEQSVRDEVETRFAALQARNGGGKEQ